MAGPPGEFIQHHLPLMFLSGLLPLAAPTLPINPGEPVDPFVTLVDDLRKVMVSPRAFNIWDNSRGSQCDFHVMLVDKVSSNMGTVGLSELRLRRANAVECSVPTTQSSTVL